MKSKNKPEKSLKKIKLLLEFNIEKNKPENPFQTMTSQNN